jgi:3-oxochol-4-en-24-oyl-CoA dehydrogenase
MPIGITEEHEALRQAARGWVERHCAPAVARASLDAVTDAVPLFWGDLAAQGWLGLHVDEALGGEGYGLPELAVVLEELGRVCAPGPFLPTVLAAAVLQAAGKETAADMVPGLASGGNVGTVALRGRLDAEPAGDGLRVRGTLRAVPSAHLAGVLVAQAGDDWCALIKDEFTAAELESLDPTRRVAEVRVDGAVVPNARRLDGVDAVRVRDLAATVFAAESVGVAQWCVDTASEYAKVREQFGRPIGQFQAIKHKCARMLIALEQARAMVWDAARALDEARGRDEAALASAVTATLAPDAAVQCAQDCIQVHGGIGYTWEHDAHMYYRRALTLRALTGSSARWAGQVAALALAGVRREPGIDLPAEAGPVRERIQAEIAEVAALPEGDHSRLLAERGLVMPHLREPWGRGAGPLEQVLIQQEMRAAGVRPPVLAIGAWVIPSLVTYGTLEQQDRFLPATLRGEMVWCQLFSEPGAGSDLASLRMRAQRANGGWKLTGQKIWTSLAHRAEWAICLARTDPDKPKHEGITYFLVDMKSPGIDVRPLTEMTGEKLFNEVFFDGVFVPDDCVVGEVNAGWKVARNTLANERVSLSSGGTAGLGVKELLDTAGTADTAGTDRLGPAELEHIGRLCCEDQSIGLLALRVTLRQLSGSDPGSASSVRKLLGMEHAQHIAEACWSLLGARGAIGGGAAAGPEGWWGRMVLATRAMTIYGGTTEVQLNIIAEHMLGLPRDP